jgi:Flp pilus assembly protein TadG
VAHTSIAHTEEQGQAAVEFALALPVLCLLLLGTISFGQMIWTAMDLVSATRGGARRAAVARADTTTSPDTQVRTVLKSSLDRTDPAKVNITISGTWTQDAPITVRSKLPYDLSVMGIVLWHGDLTSTSQVRIG